MAKMRVEIEIEAIIGLGWCYGGNGGRAGISS
jgi:hypothetical protein